MFTNRKKLKLQGKTAAHRKSLIRSQVIELVRVERIKTTPRKAKALKATFDRLVSNAKLKGSDNRRDVESFFSGSDKSVVKFYSLIEEKFSDRDSGFTRIIRTLPRKGDGAEQSFVMLINTEMQDEKSRLKKLLEKEEKKEEKKTEIKKTNTTLGKLTKVIGKKAPVTPKGKEKTAHTLRNSK